MFVQQEFEKGLVSCIVPTYNRGSLLKESVLSIIVQSYRPIECIVVDDGSTDDTKAIVDELCKSVDEQFSLHYIYQQNAGAQVARNRGTAASTGEFIQYLDSDDLLDPQKIYRQVNFLRSNIDCDGVFGDWRKGGIAENELVLSSASDDYIKKFICEQCIVIFSFIMRRSIIQKIGEWDVSIKRNQEIDFQLRGLIAGADFRYQPGETGLWRIHENERIANTTGAKEFTFFFQKWERILTDKKMFSEQMKKSISNIYFWFAIQNGNKEGSVNILQEAVRLNPAIHFIQTRKMRLLRKVFGLRLSLKAWLLRSGFN